MTATKPPECSSGKITYATQSHANRAANEFFKRIRKNRGKAYFCKYCGFWHIASEMQIARRTRVAKKMFREMLRYERLAGE